MPGGGKKRKEHSSVQEALGEFQQQKKELAARVAKETTQLAARLKGKEAEVTAVGQQRYEQVTGHMTDSGSWLEGTQAEHKQRKTTLTSEVRKVQKAQKAGGTLEDLAAGKQRIAELLRELQAKCIRMDREKPQRTKSVSFRM